MRDIKVFIDDGLMLAREKPTGIGWYTLNLMRELPGLGIQVKRKKYSDLFCSMPTPIKRIVYLAASFGNCLRKDVDLIHYTNFYVPPCRHRVPVVSTIHDLTSYLYPQTLPASYRYYCRFAVACAVKYADLILTPSEAVKIELLDRFKTLTDDKVKVVFQDIRDLFFTAVKTDVAKEHFLYVGVLEKRKNLEMLIRTFSRFSENFKNAKLVLIGKPGFGFDEINQAIGQSKNVVYYNYMPDDELVKMYNKSHALIMPSLYEGFGRPVIEAMALGLPVIASNIPTNRELLQRHGKIELVNLTRPEELLSLLETLLTTPRARIDYGNLDMYRTTEVAHRHVEAYQLLFKPDSS